LKQARVDEDVYEKLKLYAKVTDKSITQSLNEALDDWLDTIGMAHVDRVLYPGETLQEMAARLERNVRPVLNVTQEQFNKRMLCIDPSVGSEATA
jgi:hypothetical protein